MTAFERPPRNDVPDRLFEPLMAGSHVVTFEPNEILIRFGGDGRFLGVLLDGGRELVFGDVLVRVNPDCRLAMHIDTDEANAANVAVGAQAFVDSIQSRNQN
jgi:propanediol utilization protein